MALGVSARKRSSGQWPRKCLFPAAEVSAQPAIAFPRGGSYRDLSELLGPGSLAPQSLCVIDMVCHGAREEDQKAKLLSCLLGSNLLETVESCLHSCCMAGSFVLRRKDRVSHVCQKPKSHLRLCWGWHQAGDGVRGKDIFISQSPGLSRGSSCMAVLDWEEFFPSPLGATCLPVDSLRSEVTAPLLLPHWSQQLSFHCSNSSEVLHFQCSWDRV